MAQDLNLNQRLIVTDTDGVRVTGITSGTYLEISGNLPGYTNGQYPVLKSGGTIHFGVNGSYRAYLEGNDTYLGILNNSSVTTVLLKTSGSSYLNGGNVGIGTTGPGELLDVRGNIRFGTGGTGSWGEGLLTMNSGWGTGKYPTLGSYDGSAGSLIMLHNPHTPFRTDNAASTSYTGRSGLRMAIDTAATGWWDAGLAGDFYHIFKSTGGEFLRITNTGNVGIGTTSPNYRLDVNGEGQIGYINFEYNSNYAGIRWKDSGYNLRWKIGNDGPSGNWLYLYDYAMSTSAFTFKPNGDMSFTPGGNVSIGSTSSGAKLTVVGSAISISNGWTGTHDILFVGGTPTSTGAASQTAARIRSTASAPGGAATGDLLFTVNKGDAFVDALYIKETGNVGIGTNNPVHKTEIRRLETVNRTTYTDILSINADADNAPYSGHGGGILFRGQTYSGSSNNNQGNRLWGRIGMYLNDSYDNFAGESMFFDVASDDRSDTLTTAMTIKYNGYVGIGTTNPQAPLEVYKANSGGLGGHIILNNNGLAVGNETAILFNDSGIGSVSSVRAAISSSVEGSPYYGDIKFKTGATSYGSLSTRMIITGAGNVGIGTTSPSYKLHVQGTSYFFDQSIFGDKVGIGTTSPAYKLDVQENTTSDPYVQARFLNTNTSSTQYGGILVSGNNQAHIRFLTGTSAWGGDGAKQWQIRAGYGSNIDALSIYSWTAGKDVIYFNSSGNVGIGTDSPGSKFVVNNNGGTGSTFYVDAGNIASTQTLFEHTGSNTPVPFAISKSGYSGNSANFGILYLDMAHDVVGGGANMYFTLRDSNSNLTEYGGLGATIVTNTDGSESGRLNFYTTNSGSVRQNRMVISPDGSVGIGTTSPAATLDVNGNAIFRVSDSQNDTGGFTITNDGAASNVRSWLFNSNPIMLVTSTNAGTPHIGINQSSDTSDGARIYGYKSRGTVSTNSSVANGDEIFTLQAWPMHTAGPNQYKYGGSQTWYKDDNGGTASTYAPVSLRWNMSTSTTTTATVMTLLYNGNLGIGTTNPSGKLHVYGGRIVIDNPLDSQSAIQFNQAGTEMAVLYRPGNVSNEIRMYTTAGGDVMSWNQGSVGIGTNTPGAKLDVNGEVRSNGGFTTQDGSFTRVLNPGGAAYSGDGGVTGAFKITLPMTWSNTMMRMTVKIYDYSDGKSFTIELGGYNYSPNSTWYSTFAHTTCDSGTDRNFTVRFGHDGTKNCIYIGELASTWSYPKIAVVDAEFGHSNFESYRWNDGWDIRMETTGFSSVSSTIQNTQATNWKRTGQDVYYGGGSGRVGIGTTAPNGKLHVYGSASGATAYGLTTGVNIESNSISGINILSPNNGYGRIYFGAPISNTAGAVEYIHDATLTSGYMKLRAGGADRVFILGNGNVGIGTTAPGTKLDVVGKVRLGPNTSQSLHAALNVSAGEGSNSLYRDIDIHGSWSTGEAHAITATYSSQLGQTVGQMVFQYTNPGSRIRWGAFYHSGSQTTYPMELVSDGNNGNLILTGKLGVGNTSPSYSIDVSGGAIAIRGNAAGNSLRFDDTTATSRNAMYVDASNYLNIGNANYAGVKFVQTASAPTTGEFAGNQIQNAIGGTTNGVILAEPSAWLAVRVGTVDYAIPMYTTG